MDEDLHMTASRSHAGRARDQGWIPVAKKEPCHMQHAWVLSLMPFHVGVRVAGVWSQAFALDNDAAKQEPEDLIIKFPSRS